MFPGVLAVPSNVEQLEKLVPLVCERVCRFQAGIARRAERNYFEAFQIFGKFTNIYFPKLVAITCRVILGFQLQELNDVCNCICEECYNFVNKLERFKDRCLQTSKMLVELCATSTEDDELLESDVQDLRFRFLSDSILTAVDEDPEEKSLVSGLGQTSAPDACEGMVTFDQVDTNDLVEPELVELKIEKISPGKRKSKS